jgi:hypothetical protein
MLEVQQARVLSEDELQRIERDWARSDERKRLDEQRERILEKMSAKKACHSY